MATPGSLTREAFSTPAGAMSPSAMNSPDAARGELARAWGNRQRRFAREVLRHALPRRKMGRATVLLADAPSEWMTTRLAQGIDKTLQTETAFSAGFMLDPLDASGKKEALYLRTDHFRVRPSRSRRKPGFCRSGEPPWLCLCHEPDGIRRPAEIPSARARSCPLRFSLISN